MGRGGGSKKRGGDGGGIVISWNKAGKYMKSLKTNYDIREWKRKKQCMPNRLLWPV